MSKLFKMHFMTAKSTDETAYRHCLSMRYIQRSNKQTQSRGLARTDNLLPSICAIHNKRAVRLSGRSEVNYWLQQSEDDGNWRRFRGWRRLDGVCAALITDIVTRSQRHRPCSTSYNCCMRLIHRIADTALPRRLSAGIRNNSNCRYRRSGKWAPLRVIVHAIGLIK